MDRYTRALKNAPGILEHSVTRKQPDSFLCLTELASYLLYERMFLQKRNQRSLSYFYTFIIMRQIIRVIMWNCEMSYSKA